MKQNEKRFCDINNAASFLLTTHTAPWYNKLSHIRKETNMKSTHTRLLSVFFVFVLLIGIFTSCALTEENSTLQYEFKAPSGSGKSSAKIVAQDTEPQITDSLDVSETLSKEKTNEVIIAAINSNKFGSNNIDDYSIRCYGIFGDACAVFIDCKAVEYPAMDFEEEIDGLIFKYGSTQTLMIFSNGNLYRLNEAYTNSIIDFNSLNKLYDTYSSDKWFYYTEQQNADNFDVSKTTYLSPIKGLEELSPSLVKEINDAWTAKFGCEYKGDVLIDLDYINKYAWSDRYLGTIDEFVVVLRPAALAAETKKIIGGYEFVLGSAFNLMLYKNGIFYTLEEAYSNKIVGIEFVKTVYLRNNEYRRYFNPEITIRDKLPLNDTELAKINDDWQKQIGNGEIFIESNDKFSNHNSVFYFGNFNSCYVLMKKMSNEKGAVLIEISGRRIMIPESYVLVAYKDGVFYSLQEAYEKNYLTDEDIFNIAEEISISQFYL